MNPRQTQTITMRISCLLASAVVTALIVGSQLGIADGYTQQADAVLAARNAQRSLAQSPAASASSRT
jgi:hypothetical protein